MAKKRTKGREQDAQAIAAKAARGFKNLQCEECAASIKKRLLDAGEHGKVIEIRGSDGRRFIVCGSHKNWTDSITQNGHHLGVQVGDKVFDNHHPDGWLFDDWLKDFAAPGGIEICSKVPF